MTFSLSSLNRYLLSKNGIKMTFIFIIKIILINYKKKKKLKKNGTVVAE